MGRFPGPSQRIGIEQTMRAADCLFRIFKKGGNQQRLLAKQDSNPCADTLLEQRPGRVLQRSQFNPLRWANYSRQRRRSSTEGPGEAKSTIRMRNFRGRELSPALPAALRPAQLG